VFGEIGTARRVGQHRVLDHVLRDRFDERIVAHRLHEDRAVLMPRCRGHIHLNREPQVLLQHRVMNVLDALEPCKAVVVNVVRLVVEDGQLINFADDFAQIDAAVIGLADRLRSNGARK